MFDVRSKPVPHGCAPVAAGNRKSAIVNRQFKGFNLVEVMFAVITLGIGLIMVAAIFPVAIQQTKNTAEEGVGTSLAWTGVSSLQAAANRSGSFPPTGLVVSPLAVSDFRVVAGNMILPSDPRYAWVPLYRRLDTASPAQIFLIPVRVRNSTSFVLSDITTGTGRPLANLQPRPVRVRITNGTGGNADTIEFSASPNGTLGLSNAELGVVPSAVAEGSYVIIASDNITSPAGNIGRMNGRIYRVGTSLGGNTWELAPGNDFAPDPGVDGVLRDTLGGSSTSTTDDIDAIGQDSTSPSNTNATLADAFIVGRGFSNSAATPTAVDEYTGPAMDVSVFTGFVNVKQ